MCTQNNDQQQSIRQCIANLCSHLDADLVNALLDDDQLLTSCQNDCDSVLSPIVKAFRQLHAQLKEELSCALSGQISNKTFPFHLLSILEKQKPFVDKTAIEEKKKNDEENVSSEYAESVSVISSKKQKINGENGQQLKTDAYTMTQRNVLELQFINALSLGSGGRKCEFVDRSIQVESDLDSATAPNANNFKAESHVKSAEVEKEENLVESVSAASIYNGKESSFSTTTTTTANSTNSTEMSVGEMDRRKATQMLAVRNDIKVYTVDVEGALLTSAGKRERKGKRLKTASVAALPVQLRKERREGCHHHHFSECSSAADASRSCSAITEDSCGATSSNSSICAIVPPKANERGHSAEADDGEMVEILSAKMFTKRLSTIREITSFNTDARQLDANGEEEEQSTLNQVTPIPTTLELSN